MSCEKMVRPAVPREIVHHLQKVYDIGERRTCRRAASIALDGACTNYAEEYFSRLRRAEIGIHHHMAGAYLLRYAQGSSRREDNRRVSNGDQVSRVAALAMKRGKSVDFSVVSFAQIGEGRL
jgi:hypothetical protein